MGILDGAEIRRLAAAEGCRYSIDTVDETGSTNDELKKLAAKGTPGGYALIAAKQSAGRGRMGHSFFSPATGLYMSVLLRPNTPPEETLHLTAAAGIAVSHAIERMTGKCAEIKWVNDIYIGGKKVCGILTESALAGARTAWAVVGIGINITEPQGGFPDDIKDRACALFPYGTDLPAGFREEFAAVLLAEFDRQISLPWEDTLAEYRSRSYLTGREVALSDGQKALVTGISPDGGLTVKLPTGQTLSISSQFSVRELS